MDELFEVSLLLDFYGQMLTPRQYEIMDLHFNNDYSLGEIAQYLDISRQGVHDNIKHGKAALAAMEEKLGLAGRYLKQKDKIAGILDELEKIDPGRLDSEGVIRMDAVRKAVRELMED